MSREELTPFHAIGHNIKAALENRAYGGALILTYAAIDAMAFLSMPENQKEVVKKDFVDWVERFMKTDLNQPYQYKGIDLYGARCGLLHRYGATSSLSDRGECKIFGYHNGSEHMFNPKVDENLVLISWKRFINDFFGAMSEFLKDILSNKELKKRVYKRIGDLFYVSPIEPEELR